MRTVSIALGVLALIGAVVAASVTRSLFPALVPAVLGVLILAGTLFERHRYKRLQDMTPGAGWTDTGERFMDPETQAPVAVFFNQTTGERRYVRISAAIDTR